MKFTLSHIVVLVLLLMSFRPAFQIDDWLLERERKGIKVFTRKSKWSKVKDSKAVMHIPDAKMEDIIKLITDFDHYPDWVPRCKSARVLARLSDNEFIAQMRFNAPWPIADRECVVRVKVERDPVSRVVYIRETSEPKYINKSADVVRIEQMFSTWKLVPKSGAVEVTNEYSSNPGGNIPDWMTNTQAVENPYDIFTHLQSVMPTPAKKGR